MILTAVPRVNYERAPLTAVARDVFLRYTMFLPGWAAFPDVVKADA